MTEEEKIEMQTLREHVQKYEAFINDFRSSRIGAVGILSENLGDMFASRFPAIATKELGMDIAALASEFLVNTWEEKRAELMKKHNLV